MVWTVNRAHRAGARGMRGYSGVFAIVLPIRRPIRSKDMQVHQGSAGQRQVKERICPCGADSV